MIVLSIILPHLLAAQSCSSNQGQVAKVDRDLRRTIHDDDTQTVYG
jgi:hypothetical protein